MERLQRKAYHTPRFERQSYDFLTTSCLAKTRLSPARPQQERFHSGAESSEIQYHRKDQAAERRQPVVREEASPHLGAHFQEVQQWHYFMYFQRKVEQERMRRRLWAITILLVLLSPFFLHYVKKNSKDIKAHLNHRLHTFVMKWNGTHRS